MSTVARASRAALAAYELVGPNWQLNVINVHVRFSDFTVTAAV